ncbi:dephospho-CoA kinase [Inediibacterium massiliense]|uniref:dephospho-CoA kinase n=1 Tax=Inediibacterium massiliense TaxID=1658111 RepID=UPI0006B444D1|nr:dephospho-CoA kinase [Inediibacterium massiliense]
MKVIGLTGGIATGKSTASFIIKGLGVPVIDADLVAREIVEPKKEAFFEIVKYFGEEVLQKNGDLDRKKLGNIVFSNQEKLKKLNDITHQRIIDEIINKINMYRKLSIYPVIIVDAALLIEMKMNDLVDEVWLVITDKQTQIYRLMERDGFSFESAKKRINAQMSTEEKTKYAHVVLNNSGSIEDLTNKIQEELKRVREY